MTSETKKIRLTQILILYYFNKVFKYVYFTAQNTTYGMYINALMKYQLHQGYMFRPKNNHHQANAEHIQGTT